MNRRDFLAATTGCCAALAQRKLPNIVLIVADDLGWGDISANGCPDIRTPNIDGIAKQGVRFTQCYASAPECTPTRCALLTGRYPQRVGGLECAIGVNNLGRYDEAEWLQKRGELGLPAAEQTVSKLLNHAGYDTACIGKWHLGYLEKFRPNRHGFHYFLGILGGNADYYTHEEQGEGKGQTHLYENDRKVERKGYMTDIIADGAIEWLKRRSDKPVFLYLAFTAPHSPIQAPQDFDPATGTAPHRSRHRPTYVRMVEYLDKRIGDVLQQAPAENTIVVFVSDNGADANGRNLPFRGQKSSVWEGGIRTPLHIRWPGVIKPGTETSQVALSMDLAPTFAAAAGLKGKFDGDDLLPVIIGRKQPYQRTVCWRYRRGKATRKAIRHGEWKCVDDSGTVAMYNLKDDPQEQRDLLSGRPEIAKDLKARLTAWEEEVASPRLRGFPQREEKSNG
jgi:N-acetylgalactosamine-6-sulfatase